MGLAPGRGCARCDSRLQRRTCRRRRCRSRSLRRPLSENVIKIIIVTRNIFLHVHLREDVVKKLQGFQVSISSTLNARVFCTNVVSAAFFYVHM